jgi:hypothetical protein
VTKTAGKKFEDEVAKLLSLANFEVRRELIIGHKKVDLLIQEKRLGTMRRIAVECKNYHRPLTQEEVSVIYANYLPLQKSNLVDEILLITSKGLTPSALTMIEESRQMSHMLDNDIFDLVMDFGLYLSGIQRQFDENGLARYYIPPITAEGEPFEEIILGWIANSDSKPLAILGSYGTGKTTLAKRIASILAPKAREQRSNRIPILVRLGEISSEQSLEGLLGKLFTAHSVVRNYTFDLFMALNEMGRFALFLDGFDEMKHTLTWQEFRYNFRQLNRLVCGNSKVIILGRPTAFLNDDEYRHALRGIRSVGRIQIRERDWPEYRELHLAPFSKEQSESFLRKYLSFRAETADNPEEKKNFERALDRDISMAFDTKFSDLSRRPVQLKMLAEVLPTWKGEIEDLTVSVLYNHFIDLIIEREQDKLARRRFGLEARRLFARDLAMFLWLSKGEMSITADSIPAGLIAKHCKAVDDAEAVKRDLVSACFLDRKLGDSLFFPHRSFQEFLVAEALIEEISSETRRFTDISQIANDEIAEFMGGIITLDTLKKWTERFERSNGIISLKMAEVWLRTTGASRHLWERLLKTNSPWHPELLAVAAHTNRLGPDISSQLVEVVTRKIDGPIGRYSLACLWCVMLVGSAKEIGHALRKATRVEAYDPRGEKPKKFKPEYDVVRLFSNIDANGSTGEIDLTAAYPRMFSFLAEYCLIADRVESSQTSDLIAPFLSDLPQKVTATQNDVLAILDFKDKYCGKKRR